MQQLDRFFCFVLFLRKWKTASDVKRSGVVRITNRACARAVRTFDQGIVVTLQDDQVFSRIPIRTS